jgi:hypothetical protein
VAKWHLGPPSFQTRFLAQALFSFRYVSGYHAAVRAQSSVSPCKGKKSGAFQGNEKSFMGDTTDHTDITDGFLKQKQGTARHAACSRWRVRAVL